MFSPYDTGQYDFLEPDDSQMTHGKRDSLDTLCGNLLGAASNLARLEMWNYTVC